MAVQAELCCLDAFPAHVSLLDALIRNSDLGLVFRKQHLLFTPHGSGSASVVLRVHPTTEEYSRTEPTTRVRIYTSRFFWRLRDLPRLGTVRPVDPVSLDRVVVGARSKASLRWTGTEQFSAGLQELCRQEPSPLVRQGDPLLLPRTPELLGPEPLQVQLDLLVLECSPVTQGRITAHTSFVVTDWDLCDPPAGLPIFRPLRLFVSDFAHCADGLSGRSSLLDSSKLVQSGFCGVLQALECRVDVCVVDTQRWCEVKGPQGTSVDVNSSIFVSKQLLLKLGLFNHEWVELSRPGGFSKAPPDHTDRPTPTSDRVGVVKEHLSCVVVVDLSPDLDLSPDTGFMSSTLWFNLSDGESVPASTSTLRIKRWRQSPRRVDGQHSESFCRLVSPPFTTELHIQPVVSPLYGTGGNYGALLSEHFSTPRLVSLGDVLSVPAGNHPDLLEKNAEGIHRSPVLFFRVQKVCTSAEPEDDGGGAYLADRCHTSLYMGAPTSSRVPPASVGGADLWRSLSPPGLTETVDHMISVIMPHLHHRSSLSGCTVLLHGPAGSGKVTAVSTAGQRLHLHLMKVDCVTLCADTPAASEAKLMAAFQRADTLRPCILLLRNLHLLFQPHGGAEQDGRVEAALRRLLSGVSTSVVVVATASRARELSSDVMAAFLHVVAVERPNEQQRCAVLAALSRDLHLGRDINLQHIARLTAGFVLGDLSAVVVEAGRAACRRLLQICQGRQQEDLCLSGVTILNQDFINALETLQKYQSRAIGAPKIPKVHWEDVGGLQRVKKEILDTIQLPLQHPQLLSLGLNRTGVLLYGPPGTGKTLLAKAVATECSMTFLSVKGPELINMYVGQSEENVREVFSRAMAAAPCVVFFDELDSLAPSRGRSGDSGGVMDRVISQLLAELDALHSSAGIFVIGATNRPDLLDQSLLRPGRFDKLVYVGVNEDRDSQILVLQAVLRKCHDSRHQEEDLPH
ncbi:peroxisome assembly factor 2 isoform X2 [Thalassophryne amazonica]|uniref:peroxisome assembly factor 2 isoform X2 n=1 Tax=Thalassophryne amazonica TaxID=390379 RepID=UPI0014713DB2|nr:peroxisome assembly factor 2 isoform X2 [Thalassophryne amazonica]